MNRKTSAARSKPLALFLSCILLMVNVISLAGSVGNLLTDVQLTGFTIKTYTGNDLPAAGIPIDNRVRLDIKWDASAYGYNIREGQYFDITLPGALTFPDLPGNRAFKLYTDGSPVHFADVAITSPPGGGGTLRMTFASFIQDNQWSEVKGTLYFYAHFVRSKIEVGKENTFTVDIAGQYTQSETLIVTSRKPEAVQNEAFKKWSGAVADDSLKARWTIRINAQEKPMTNVVVKDFFPRGDTDSQIFIDRRSFTLQKVLYTHNDAGEIVHDLGYTYYQDPAETIDPDTDDRLQINPGATGFTFTLGDTEASEFLKDGKPRHYTYLLRYVSSYEPGKLVRNSASGSYTEGPAGGQSFPNSYRSYGAGGDGTGTNAGYTARKLWVNRPATGQVVPTFLLKQDGAVMAEQPTPAITEYNDFIVYQWTQLPVTNPDTAAPYVYSVEEKGVAGGLVVLDGHLYRMQQDGGDITNIYLPPASMPLFIRKVYDGPALTGTEVFTFQLLSEDKNTVLDTRTATTAGVIAFNDLEFSAAGTYTFHLKEVMGSAPGVTYDDSEYTLTYAVLLDSDTNALGADLAEVKKNNTAINQAAPLVFQNTYTAPEEPEPPRPTAAPTPTAKPITHPTAAPVPPSPTYPTLHVPLSVKKVLKNGALQAGAFTFELRDGKGKFIAQATNAADGTVVFPDRTFSKVVTNYLYTIREIPGADARMVYDDTVYTVKVSTRAVKGQLEATINVEKNGTPFAGPMVFTNQRKLPPTGDSAYTTMALLVGASLLLMGGAYVLNRRRNRHDAA